LGLQRGSRSRASDQTLAADVAISFGTSMVCARAASTFSPERRAAMKSM